jgi:hypothetical protein
MFKYLESFSTNRLTSPTRLFLTVVATGCLLWFVLPSSRQSVHHADSNDSVKSENKLVEPELETDRQTSLQQTEDNQSLMAAVKVARFGLN